MAVVLVTAARADAPARLHLPAEAVQLHFAAAPRPAPGFGAAAPALTSNRSNAMLAQQFVQIIFHLERGAPRQALPRWPLPVTVELDPRLKPGFGDFLEEFLGRIRRESGVAIHPDWSPPETPPAGRIVVRLAPTFAMMRRVGASLCVAAPGDHTWEAFESERDIEGVDADRASPGWSDITRPTAATVFIPDRARPFQIRACLMEELIQALGPAGDFFVLTDSIFNDDGVRSNPTDFDFLMLRTLYSPLLARGMNESEALVAARAALDLMRPGGARADQTLALASDAEWLKQIRAARAQRHPVFAEAAYARAATRAERFTLADPRRLFTAFERAKNMARFRPAAAVVALEKVESGYRALLGAGNLYTAAATLERAETLLALARFDEARRLAAPLAAVFLRDAREDLLAETILLRSAAERGARQIHTDQPLSAADAPWRDYAFGLAQPVLASVKPPPPSTLALSLAITLTMIPAMFFVRLLLQTL